MAREQEVVPGYSWLKVTDVSDPFVDVQQRTDMRVLLPADEEFAILAEKLASSGAQVRRVRYLLEDEIIAGDGRQQYALSRACRLNRPYRAVVTESNGAEAAAARDAFDLMWESHSVASVARHTSPSEAGVPQELGPYLPFATLNPAQAEALPQVFGHDENLLVVAPTGAGKTVIGMAAALRAVVLHRRKAAWLVPQRSLTDELDSELAGWRDRGLRVERLSGEHSIDIERIRDADLWVATTEKFEAICRTSAFRESLADVVTLVVDEIHLLGDQTRGPVLEALLARLRDGAAGTRIIGLSATVSNAQQIARWLRARLLRCAWRPNRLTWQLPSIPAHADFAVTEAARARLAAAITGLVAGDGGSTLVFCGSKRNVRRTALLIAASRIDVSGVRPDDLDRLHQVCRQAGVGLHYQGWEHRREAERAFRQRELDVLVATTTVAAGVNLPARAVIVQDTQVGLQTLDVATVQQMFGRAGRVGTGEADGSAFLIVDERERASWQAQLVAGHTVRSRIRDGLAEHVLSEAVQQRVGTLREAEQWWVQTLACHQRLRSVRPLRKAVAFLRSAEMLEGGGEPDAPLTPTELGRLTARLMVEPQVCDALRAALGSLPVPDKPGQAEQGLIEVLAQAVPKLARALAGEDSKAALTEVLAAFNAREPAASPRAASTGSADGQMRGDLARAALLIVARSPGAFRPGVRQVHGIPYAAMYQILEEAPRYLHWIACQGLFGTIHPWCAVVAADLEMRTTWRMLQPPRGSGRLLWACEEMATPAYSAQDVPRLWAAARAHGYVSPDWTVGGRPAQCRLDPTEYASFLRDRATVTTINSIGNAVRGTGPAGSVLAVWTGSAYQVTPLKRGYAIATLPSENTSGSSAAIFTWRGDYRATGWLSSYSQIADSLDGHPVEQSCYGHSNRPA